MEETNKIGLLTIHHTTNFGSALQTYGLYQAVKSLGYPIELIDYRCSAIENRENLAWQWNDPRSIYRYLRYGAYFRQKSQEFACFLSSYADMSPIYTSENVAEANDRYDTFLIGSDIVWGVNVTGADMAYFLDFVKEGKKKAAFGASCGVQWPEEIREQIAGLLRKFDYIGVRETAVAEWIRQAASIVPDIVCDPTMLWKPQIWEKMAEGPSMEGGYVLVYFCDSKEKILKDAREYAAKYKLPIYYINYGKKQKGIHSIQPYKIGEFLGLIRHADCIFTASYHGLLFSLYFQKEFYYYNRANFSRMQSLAKWLCIENRDGLNRRWSEAKEMDREEINGKLEAARNESWDKLRKYLAFGRAEA